jgi:beta-galactosidase
MDRRRFLKATSALIAGAKLAPFALPEDAAPVILASAAGRIVFPLNRNWRYSRTFVEGGHAKDFDDSKFENVVIPHTNVNLPWHGFDDRTYEFVSLYRRRFKLPPAVRGKHVFVDFEGAMTASTVWINGVRLGEYRGGYTPFSFELTAHLDFEGENVLAVDLDSTERPDIPPFGYEIDYLTFGGIYREVSLRIVPGSFIENMFVRPKNVLSGAPGVEVDCFIHHLDQIPEGLNIEVELVAGERVLAKASQPLPPRLSKGNRGRTQSILRT